MSKSDILEQIALEKAKFNELRPCRGEYDDAEDFYQAKLEYNWWCDEQSNLIASLEEELVKCLIA